MVSIPAVMNEYASTIADAAVYKITTAFFETRFFLSKAMKELWTSELITIMLNLNIEF